MAKIKGSITGFHADAALHSMKEEHKQVRVSRGKASSKMGFVKKVGLLAAGITAILLFYTGIKHDLQAPLVKDSLISCTKKLENLFSLYGEKFQTLGNDLLSLRQVEETTTSLRELQTFSE